jgi:uncharacterized phage protein (TIGR01671 family)
MRKVLFRAKKDIRGTDKETSEWVTGTFAYFRNIAGELYPAIIPAIDLQPHIDYPAVENNPDGIVRVDPETLCQYTGLRDYNGKRIFEGDVLCLEGDVQQYKWTACVCFGGNDGDDYTWGFKLEPIGDCIMRRDIRLWVDAEENGVYAKIIGNAFDNPTLIEQGGKVREALMGYRKWKLHR